MNSSEFVRQELRAAVSARTQQQLNNVRSSQSPIAGANSMMGGNAASNNNNANQSIPMQNQQQMTNNIMNTNADMGFNFDLPTTGERFYSYIVVLLSTVPSLFERPLSRKSYCLGSLSFHTKRTKRSRSCRFHLPMQNI